MKKQAKKMRPASPDEEAQAEGHTIVTAMSLALSPVETFAAVAHELSIALSSLGISFEPGPGGRIKQGMFEVGRVTTWEPGRRATFLWRPASWKPGKKLLKISKNPSKIICG